MEENLNENENLKHLFEAAASHVKKMVLALSKEQMLAFYGYYKQATEGSCRREKPRWYEFAEKQKWEAWSALKDMDSETAMENYVKTLNDVEPKWRDKLIQTKENHTGWVHHSCMMANDEEDVEDSDKTIFDWVKESNADKVREEGSKVVEIDKQDESGLTLLHWASDRGNLDIVAYLVENLKADVNTRDSHGQTPLHFAVSCEHEDVAQYLIQAGADASLKDNDGLTPYENSS